MNSTLVSCPQCQAELQPGMLRCRSCGARLPKQTTSPTPQPASENPVTTTPSVVKAVPSGVGGQAVPASGGTAFQLETMLSAATPPAQTKVPAQPATPNAETGRHPRAAVPSKPSSSQSSASTSRPQPKSTSSTASGRMVNASSIMEIPPGIGSQSDEPSSPQRLSVSCVCQARFRVKPELAGKKIKCPKCQQMLTVPGGNPEVTTSGRYLVAAASSAKKFADFAAALVDQPPLVASPCELKAHLGSRKLSKFTKAIEKKNGEGKPEAELRAQAIREFGQTTDARVLDMIAPLVDDYWISVREAVADALGTLRDPAATPLLVRLLDDEVPDVKRQAVVALGNVGDARAVPALLNLALQEPLFRFTAGDAITRIGKPAIAVLIETLKADDPGLALEAIVVLGKLRDAQATDAVAAMLGQRLGVIRSHAAETLGLIGDPKAGPALIRALGDPDAIVRANVAVALQHVADKRAVKPLIKLLEDEDVDVCSRAATTLGELGDAQAARPMLPLLEHADPQVRAAAAEALGRLGDEIAAVPLTRLFHDDDETTRLKAVSAFRRFRSAEAVNPLLMLLDDSNVAIRQRAVDALGEMENLAALDRLIVTLRTDTAVEVRMAAAKALGLLRSPKALPALEEALDDELTVQCRCIAALGDIGDASSLPALLAMLKDPTPEVRYHASQSLAEIGHQNSRKPLEELLADDNLMVRRGAAKALVKLGDPRGEQLIQTVSAKPAANLQSRLTGFVPDWLVGLVSPHSVGGQLVLILLVGLPLLAAGGYFLGPALMGMFSAPDRLIIRGKVASVSLSPDGKYVLAGRSSGSAEVWEIDSQSLHDEIWLPNNSTILGFVMSPDGKSTYLTSGVELLQFRDGKSLNLPSHPEPIQLIKSTADGKRAASFSSDGTTYIIDLETGKVESSLLLNVSNLVDFTLSNDGTTLAWGTYNGEASVFDVQKSEVKVTFQASEKVIRGLAMSPDNQLLAVSGLPLKVGIYDLKTNKWRLKKSIADRTDQAYSVLWFAGETGSELKGLSGRSIDTISLTDGQATSVEIESLGATDYVAINPITGRLAASGPEEDAVWVIDTATGKSLGKLDK